MENTKEIDIRLKLWSDFKLYSKYCLKIQTEDGRLVPFEFNEVQNTLQEIIKYIRSKNRLIRLVILKARREGVSTWATGRFYWKTSMNRNRYAMIIAHEPEAKDFLFNMVKRYHNHCPIEFKPEDKYNNKSILEFNNAEGTGLDSAIRVACAGKEDLGSGMKIDFLHISELSKWDRNVINPLLTSVFQTVPNDPSSEVIIESTAKGVGGEFYNRFWNSRYRFEVKLNEKREIVFEEIINENANESNEYSAIFLPFFIFKKYSLPIKDEKSFVLTDEEKELMHLYNLTKEQINWRRWTIENKCRGDINLFKQEYPMNPLECFLSSGFSVFDGNKLMDLIKNCPPPKARYEISTSNYEVYADKNGRLKVWEEPIPGRKYIIAADISEGIEGDNRDFTSIDVIDRVTGYQVAHWHGKIAPDLVANILFTLGRRYNMALLVPERNNHGLIVLNKLVNEGYKEIYCEIQENPPYKSRKRLGWLTRQSNKAQIIDSLIADLRDGNLGIRNPETLQEMLTFKQNSDGSFSAEEGMYDDRVMSIAIAKFVNKILPLYKQRTYSDIIRKITRNEDRDIKYSAWG
jgi:hypothetical protein